jgi:molybdate transport system regulatory protein
MSIIWTICGAGRGVGKTTLAMRLCKVLSDSVYVKCGHGKPKSHKHCNFYSKVADLESFIERSENSCKHIIVESNAFAASGRGDIVIFIDGITGKTNFRKDREQLRSAADIDICRDVNVASWNKVVSDKIGPGRICDDVCNLLIEHKHYLFGSTPTVRSKIWFESDGTHIFGGGLARLIENIDLLGTLQDAARASNMSYRYAWDLIRMAESHFGKVLIYRHVGGRSGGSSELSSDGLHILKVFKQLNKQVAVFADKKFAELYT